MEGALHVFFFACVALGQASACNEASPAQPTRPRSVKAPAKRLREAPRRDEPRVLVEGRDGAVPVRVEIARDPETRERGLMYRRQMDADAGMIFLFEEPSVQTFWMKNTYLPLDMIFIGEDLRVVGVVENAEPLTLTSRTVGLPSKYVLEVNAGFVRQHGISEGAPVRFEGFQP